MTSKQRVLKKKHGTPEQFAEAVTNCLGEISVEEAAAAISKYEDEWQEAGKGVTLRTPPKLLLAKNRQPIWIKIIVELELDVKHYVRLVRRMVLTFEDLFRVEHLYFARYTDVEYSRVEISALTNGDWTRIEKFFRWPGVVKHVKIEDRGSGSFAHAHAYQAVKLTKPYDTDQPYDNELGDVVHWMMNMRGLDYMREARFYSFRSMAIAHEMAKAGEALLQKARATLSAGKARNGAKVSTNARLQKLSKSAHAAARKAFASAGRHNVGSTHR